MARLAGKIALITGGTTGIGQATARLFRDEGASVIVTGVSNIDAWDDPTIEAVRSDVAKLGDIAALMAGIRERHGRLDILFANAGIPGPHHSVETVDEATYDLIMGVNFKGLYFTVQRALPLMGEGGSILLTSSLGAHHGMARASLYGASKAGVRSLGRSFAAELAPRGIRVNVLTPGPIDTPLMSRFDNAEEVKGMMRGRNPMQRLGEAGEVATAALFLASSDSSYMTGTETIVAGGAGDI